MLAVLRRRETLATVGARFSPCHERAVDSGLAASKDSEEMLPTRKKEKKINEFIETMPSKRINTSAI